MRLIDGDKLLKQFEVIGECEDCEHICEQDGNYCDYMKMRNLIKHAPTIDAVPVVRCEECCYWRPPTNAEQEDGSTVGHCTAALNGQQTDAYWFCADGTR